MNSFNNLYASPNTVASQPVETRANFIRKTYIHLAGAIGVFTLLVYSFCQTLISAGLVENVFSMLSGKFSWLIVIGAFMLVSKVADSWARNSTSKAIQYAGLGLYTLIEAMIFTPLILIATRFGSDFSLIGQAAAITGFLFLGLTFIALTTKKDFSFLGGFLKLGSFLAIGLIVVSVLIPGMSLGLWFMVPMVLIAGVSILYNTSNMIHHYRTDQYVAASLGLFASVALLFWYVIQILLSLASSD